MRILILILLACTVAAAQEARVRTGPPDTGTEPQRTQAEIPPANQITPTTKEETPQELTIPNDRDSVVRLQIFLDQKRFGPGFIDGKSGRFTRLAIENYNLSLGRKKDDLRVLAESDQGVPQTYATAIIPRWVDRYVDPSLPRSRLLQSQRKSMPYRSVAELMAERYHTSEDLLMALNGPEAVRAAKSRTAMIVPNIEPFRIEDLKRGRTHKKQDALSARHMVVDTTTKQIYIYHLVFPKRKKNAVMDEIRPSAVDGVPELDSKPASERKKPDQVQSKLIASFPITPGKTRFIPKGFWNLKNSVELPEWRYDQKLLETGVRGKESLSIPPGPNNPVGIIWNGLTKSGIGIHGTNNPRTIGRARSAGCIRLANWDAARIPTLVRPGAVVVVK
ncbi:MAG: L,D-transpeptidase [Verrucomicrobiae bacterium]|nr:L,D-transpeptidase [Verrucomicrobiae bacterium]NNJ41744.1 L,D-transpeptidase [Akkermansiaceae bacterium]